MTNTIYPCVWLDGKGQQAANLYCEAFPNTRIISESPMVVTVAIGKQKLMFLNGGPMFNPNPSISFYIELESAEAVDRTWNKLIEKGSALMPLDTYPWSERYGWLQDAFGVSWQLSVVPDDQRSQFIRPVLMFTGSESGHARAAMDHYTSIFSNSSLKDIYTYEKGEGDIEGHIKHGRFVLKGYELIAMDSSANHDFTFTEGLSLVVECETQKEIDHYWNSLTAGGEESQCGWLKDKFGVSWQIIPSALPSLMRSPERAERVARAFMTMKKMDLATLLNA